MSANRELDLLQRIAADNPGLTHEQLQKIVYGKVANCREEPDEDVLAFLTGRNKVVQSRRPDIIQVLNPTMWETGFVVIVIQGDRRWSMDPFRSIGEAERSANGYAGSVTICQVDYGVR